ncbi:MAG: hypothetical protein WCT29_02140 [Candidatus Paceibacterota bacterium]|jgi:uncharacterized membrane protein
MIDKINKTGKFFLLAIFCTIVRLLPFRAPNVEPILASVMPLSGVYGALAGFSFGTFSVLLYDIITGTFGVHTFFTAGAYGVLGILAASYFEHKEANISNYVRFSIIGTLFFDVITGLVVGPAFFHQPFLAALSGQIPFTLFHLVGNVAFAVTLSPVIHHLLIKKRKPSSAAALIDTFNPKVI